MSVAIRARIVIINRNPIDRAEGITISGFPRDRVFQIPPRTIVIGAVYAQHESKTRIGGACIVRWNRQQGLNRQLSREFPGKWGCDRNNGHHRGCIRQADSYRALDNASMLVMRRLYVSSAILSRYIFPSAHNSFESLLRNIVFPHFYSVYRHSPRINGAL